MMAQLINHRDRQILAFCIDLSRQCPFSSTAFAVGAAIATPSGEILTHGYSRETGVDAHAEEVAINKAVAQGIRLKGMNLFSSIEACGCRKSKPLSCADLMIKHGIARHVYCLPEPEFFVIPIGARKLAEAGVSVVHDPALEDAVKRINAHAFSDT